MVSSKKTAWLAVGFLVVAGCGDDGSESGRCPAPLLACGDGCVDPGADPAHCGGCGNACGAGEVCAAGTCSLSCPPGTERCGDRCVDTGSDPDHCGACGQACGVGVACEDGACGCPAGREACAGSCVDLASDAAHCGGCGNACTGGAACAAGACACPGGFDACAGACVDLQADPAHCGGCGNACPSGAACAGGECACPAGQEECAGACVDLQADPAHCGGCGNACTGGTVCDAGTCACPPGLLDCGGTCVDPLVDGANCGACGLACGGGLVCRAGGCAAATCNDGIGLPGPARIDTGVPYRGFAVGDLDGDGDPDLAIANQDGEGAVRLLENLGGRFAAPVAMVIPPSPLQALLIADLDGEGPPDLVGLGAQYTAAAHLILRGEGAAPRVLTVSWPYHEHVFAPRSPHVGDFDADGDLDLALSDGNFWSIRVAENLGGGEFRPIETPVPLPPGARPDGLAIGDMDGNGHDDLVVAEGHELYTVKTVSPFEFVPGEVYANDSQHGEVALGDLDGDGDLDAVLDEGNLARNDGTGRFTDYGALADRQTLVWRMATGDVDGDGDVDFVGVRDAEFEVLLNQGDSFRNHSRACGESAVYPFLADVDGDGRVDLLLSTPGTRSIDVVVNPGDGRFPGGYRFAEITGPAPAVARGEIDAAGGAEVLVVPGEHRWMFLVHATPDGPLHEQVGTSAGYSGAALVELDGDPQAEVATTDPATGSVVFLQGWPPTVVGSVSIGPDLLAAIAADLDGDGVPDLVTLEGGPVPGVRWLTAPALTPSPLLSLSGGATPREALAVDLDADGDDDLVVASDQGLHVLRSEGGILAGEQGYGIVARALAAGDLDGDGQVDLAVSDRDEDRVLVYLGTGTGLEVRWPVLEAGAARLAIADLDADGRNDVVALVEPHREVAVFRGTAEGLVPAGRWPGLFPYTFDAALVVADLDGDRRPDALAVDTYSTLFLPSTCLP